MAGIGDLLRLSASLPPAPDGSSGLGSSLQAAGLFLAQTSKTLESIRRYLAPATTYHAIVVDSAPATFLGTRDFGPTPFISRWVDISISSASAAAPYFAFFDENNQVPGQEMIIEPGQFRSFALATRGI